MSLITAAGFIALVLGFFPGKDVIVFGHTFQVLFQQWISELCGSFAHFSSFSCEDVPAAFFDVISRRKLESSAPASPTFF